MKDRKLLTAKQFVPAGGFIMALLLLWWFASATLMPQFEAMYHLHRLKSLMNSDLTMAAGGLAIDDTMTEQFRHRDRLVDLGVFFYKTYSPDPLSDSIEPHGRLFNALAESFPNNHLWMLSSDNTLEVWDLKENEGNWDRFALRYNLLVHGNRKKLKVSGTESGE